MIATTGKLYNLNKIDVNEDWELYDLWDIITIAKNTTLQKIVGGRTI